MVSGFFCRIRSGRKRFGCVPPERRVSEFKKQRLQEILEEFCYNL